MSEISEVSHEPSKFSDGERAVKRQFVLRGDTTDATQTTLYINDDSTNGIVNVPEDSVQVFTATIGGVQDDGNVGGYIIHGVIENIDGTTAIIGTNTAAHTSEDVAGWAAVVVADDTNDAIAVKVTGAAASNVNWCAVVEMTEVSNAV